MILFLQPTDTFFFRDGRPFTKGEQSEGYSIFPPFPSTVLGALRTAYIAENGGLADFNAGKMKSAIGTKCSLDDASIQIKGVFLGNSNLELYYPIPKDLVSKKDANDCKLHTLTVESSADFDSNSKLSNNLIWNIPKEQVEQESSSVLMQSVCREYLSGYTDNLIFEKTNFVIDEPKVGIARSRETMTAEEGMLYRINMKRFDDTPNAPQLGFVVNCGGISFPDNGMVKLGGEGKAFTYCHTTHIPDPLDEEYRKEIQELIQETQMFKLYLVTPTIFTQGWLPDWIQSHDLRSEPSSQISLELITAAVGNYVTIGGWDVANTRPKPAYRAVPAGSVYYFRLRDSTTAEEIFNHFHYKNVSDYSKQEGFGLALVGAIRKDS